MRSPRRKGLSSTLRFAALASVVCYLPQCSGARTEELLNANFITAGQTAIKLISPLDNATTNQTPVFVWGEKTGISKYRIEISASLDFSTLVLDKEVTGTNYTLDTADLKVVTQLNPVQYYWRVSAAKVADTLMSTHATFLVLETNTYYVNASSSVNAQVGNKTAPFKLVQDAVSAANSYRSLNPSSAVSIRIAAGTYTENVTLRPRISLYGGYSAVDWSRNISTNTTIITSAQTTAIFAGTDITTSDTASTIVDGLTIRGGSSSSAPNFAVYASGSPTISNNTIHGGNNGSVQSCGIFADNGSTAELSSNTINAGIGSPAIGIQVSSASASITNQTIAPGTSATSFRGIEINGAVNMTVSGNTINGAGFSGSQQGFLINVSSGSLTVTNNTITLGSGGFIGINSGNSSSTASFIVSRNVISGGTRGISVQVNPWTISGNTINAGTGTTTYGIELMNSNSTITNNVIHGGTATSENAGIYCVTSAAIISNNTINGGAGTANSEGIYLQANCPVSITNNIIFVSSTAGNRYGIFEANSLADPASLQNNLIFGAPSALYRDEGVTNRFMETDLNNSANTTGGGPLTASGNLGPTTVANFAAVNFVSSSDLHLTGTTPLNVRCGGKNTSATSCGSTGAASCGGVTLDRDALTRTASLTGTCAGASNMGAAGYSIGAFERD